MLAVRDLFYRLGINAVSVDAIVEAAETNKMTFYRHFKSKDHVIAEYLRSLSSEGDAVWDALATEYADDANKQLEGWLAYVEQIVSSMDERGCALANAAVELPPVHEGRSIIEAYKARKRDHLVNLFRQAGYSAPEVLADEVFLVFEGARINIQCGGRGGPATRVVATLRALLASAPRTTITTSGVAPPSSK
ncbi:MAG: TetR/AcrR family transcriptional regulator [Filomicrobium sp.]|nr:TetR/AcrR family transcriptional regulator [Filomicrobium sp.]